MNILFALLGIFVLFGCAVGDLPTPSTCGLTKISPIITNAIAETINTSATTHFVSTTFVITLSPVNGSLSTVQPAATAVVDTSNCGQTGGCALSTYILSEPYTVNLTTTVSSSATVTFTTTITQATATSTTSLVPIGASAASSDSSGSMVTSSGNDTATSVTSPSSSEPESTTAGDVIISLSSRTLTSTEVITVTAVSTPSNVSQGSTSTTNDNATVTVTTYASTCNASLVSPMSAVSQGIPDPTSNNTWTFVTPKPSAATSQIFGNAAASVRPPKLFHAMGYAFILIQQTLANVVTSSTDSDLSVTSSHALTTYYKTQGSDNKLKKLLDNAVSFFVPETSAPLETRNVTTGNGTFSPWWSSVLVSTIPEPSTTTITATSLSTTYAYITTGPTVNVTKYVTIDASSVFFTTEVHTSMLLTSGPTHTSSGEGASSSNPSGSGASGVATSEASGGSSTWIGIAIGAACIATAIALLYIAVM